MSKNNIKIERKGLDEYGIIFISGVIDDNVAQNICQEQRPVFQEVVPDHYSACHFATELHFNGVS